jgi:hypothetical protein
MGQGGAGDRAEGESGEEAGEDELGGGGERGKGEEG